jgi:hypothetical protein
MNPKNALASSSSPLAARTLKIVGVIVVLAALLDTLILSMPYQLLERQWQINFTTQLVDRGVVPLVGLVLVLVGFWIDSITRDLPASKTIWQNPRLYVFVLSSFLGLLFLLLFPLHLANVAQERTATIAQINKQATDAETQLNNRLQSEINSQRSQITQLLGATDEQLTQLTQNGQLNQEQAGLIRKFKADPQGVDSFLKQREDQLRAQSQTTIRTQKQQAEANLSTESLKSGLRIGISSLLLAIGYTVMGWAGLLNLRKS